MASNGGDRLLLRYASQLAIKSKDPLGHFNDDEAVQGGRAGHHPPRPSRAPRPPSTPGRDLDLHRLSSPLSLLWPRSLAQWTPRSLRL